MAFDVVGATYDIIGQHSILRAPTMFDLQQYRMPHHTYDVKQYRRYYVVYVVVGHTYDIIVVTDLRYRR